MKIYFAGILKSDFILSLTAELNALGLNIILANDLFIQKEIPKSKIIHIHWPEAYFSKGYINDKTVFAKYLDALKFYYNRNPILFTVHNLMPYDGNKRLSYQLYATTIKYSSVLIHLGPHSIEIIKKNFIEAKPKKHIIIPHHVLPTPTNIPDKAEARSKLNLPQNKYILASIGDLRFKEDVEQLWKYFNEIKASKDSFLYVHKYRNLVNRYFMFNLVQNPYLTIKELHYRFFNPHVVFNTSTIALEKLCSYISAADLMLLPRTKNLNSGVPFLVCNFHKPIISNSSNDNIQWSLEQLGYKKIEGVYQLNTQRSYSKYNDEGFTKLKDIYFSV